MNRRDHEKLRNVDEKFEEDLGLFSVDDTINEHKDK
jgi:hypothetical protein